MGREPERRCPVTTTPSSDFDEALELLTPRQKDLIVLVLGGLTAREIAVRLGLTKITIDMAVPTALRSLGVSSRAELASFASTGTRPKPTQ